LYLPLLLGGEGKECLYQYRRDDRTQPASVAVIIAEGWHTVKGQQPRTSAAPSPWCTSQAIPGA